MEKKMYQELYNNFVDNYKKTQISAEDTGLIIVKLAQVYGSTNLIFNEKEEKLNHKYAEIANSTDESTLKNISMAKCDILVKDTNQYKEAAIVKTDLQILEMYINSLKILQRGLLSEQNFSGGT